MRLAAPNRRSGSGRAPTMARVAWQVVVGLEVHAQIASASKLFSATAAGAPLSALANSLVSLHDAAHPGTLPRLNAAAVDAAVATAVLLNASVAPVSRFDRKHYSYADLPAGFQVTQAAAPIVGRGLAIYDAPPRSDSSGSSTLFEMAKAMAHGEAASTAPAAATRSPLPPQASCRIERVQLEVDSGRSNHLLAPGLSHIDLNRAGTGLLEIVAAPDIHSPEQAAAFLRHLHGALTHARICHGSMEEGHMRFDVNVSVRPLPMAQLHSLMREVASRLPVDCFDLADGRGIAGGNDDVLTWLMAQRGGGGTSTRSAGGRLRAVDAVDMAALRDAVWRLRDASGLARASGDGPAAAPALLAQTLAAESDAVIRGELARQHLLPTLLDVLVPLGPRVEVKNLTSTRIVARVIAAEHARQSKAYQADMGEAGNEDMVMKTWARSFGGDGDSVLRSVRPETRGFDAATGETRLLRVKEQSSDYRFLPEPDLLPLAVTAAHVRRIADAL